jgi:hypothetical protein
MEKRGPLDGASMRGRVKEEGDGGVEYNLSALYMCVCVCVSVCLKTKWNPLKL